MKYTKGQAVTAAAAGIASLILVVSVLANAYFLTWLAWGLIFVILEARALIDARADDTLSENIQKGTLSRTFFWNVFWKASVGTLLVWLIFHLLFGY